MAAAIRQTLHTGRTHPSSSSSNTAWQVYRLLPDLLEGVCLRYSLAPIQRMGVFRGCGTRSIALVKQYAPARLRGTAATVQVAAQLQRQQQVLPPPQLWLLQALLLITSTKGA